MLSTVKKLGFKPLNLIKRLPANYSTKPVTQEKPDQEQTIKDYEKMSNIQQKVRTKKPQKPPFVKNLLLGIVDTDIFAYPELEKDELEQLETNLKVVNNFLNQPEIKECSQPSREFLKKLAQEKLLGLRTSQFLDGRELTVTETCKFYEALSEINLKNTIINNEESGVEILNKIGSDRLKRKYLQDLIHGKALTAFCLIHALDNNLDNAQRTAVLSSDGKSWVLNGEARYIVNGSSADFFLVLAKTDNIERHHIQQHKLTAFIVERDSGIISTTKLTPVHPHLELSNIKFENVTVPPENILGEIGHGEMVLSEIYPTRNLSFGPICMAMNRNLINQATHHLIRISKEPYFLYETDAVRQKIAELTTSLYAIESITYLTSGLIDNYANQDCELESSIVKVFATEQTLQNTTACLKLIGPQAILENDWFSNIHKEAMCYVDLPDSNDNLKVIIALYGLRYGGSNMQELVKKIRNPLFHANFIFKRMWTHRKQAHDRPTLNLYLYQNLHPSLTPAANCLEYCVLRLQWATELLLSRYGQEIVTKHMDLLRLSQCLIDIYAMVACVSRASRSYCIGLQHADFEVGLATSFCVQAQTRVKHHINDIQAGHYETNDENYGHIAKRVFKFKQYFPVHPLTRNF